MAPKVGIPQALTYHYRSSRIIERFLREAGAEVIRSPKTTPEIHAAATTLGSADFCLSLRMLIGHVHYLVTQHPDLDFLLVPYLCSEDGEKTTTCSKYRDAGGVALRSLTTTLDYLMQHSPEGARRAAATTFRTAGVTPPLGGRFPVLLQPYIWSLRRDVFGVSPAARVGERLVPQSLQRFLTPHLRRCVAPFNTAYDAVMRRDTRLLDRFLADERAVRVAMICREYLVGEPLLTADLKAWFMKAGARVITPADVPAEDLLPGPQAPWAFYDTHRHFDALVEFLTPHVDGFIFAGSFGCHPDAFILDLLLDRVRQRGIPAWIFKYDEQVGSAGFQTRYETIMRLLEQRRDRRVAGELQIPAAQSLPVASVSAATDARRASTLVTNPAAEEHRVPLITWPFMSDHIELIVQELVTQAGLTPFVLPPTTASDVTLGLGSDTFTDSCCPYAFSVGSFIETLQTYFQTHSDGPARRIVALTARGEGPCSFGLYLLGHARDVPAAFGDVFRRGGHTLEFLSVGLSDVTRFIQELAELGNRKRLAPIVDYLRKSEDGTLDRLPAWRRLAEGRRLWATLAELLAPARAKLTALEAIRSKALIVRPHERIPGATTDIYRGSIRGLAGAHTVETVHETRDQALAELAAVSQDGEIRPRVAVVGEIYVVQASFANRGVIDNLLALRRRGGGRHDALLRD